MIDIHNLFLGSVFGLIGGIAYIFFWRVKETYEAVRHVVLAGIAGIIYTLLRSEYGFPDLIVTVIVGWFGPDFVSGITHRFRPPEEEET